VRQPEPGEDPLVGRAHIGVDRLEFRVGERERIRVLHQELAAAQQPGTGTGLVPIFRLDLEQQQRKVPIRTRHVLHQQGEHLFVGGRQQVVGAAPVLQREDVVAVLGPAVAHLVRLAGQQRRERDLLPADRGHLGPHQRGHPVEDQLAEREPGVAAGGGAPDEPGAQQQPMARHLRVRRLLTQGLEQQGGHSQQHAEQRREEV
jgi:hypothetical protein